MTDIELLTGIYNQLNDIRLVLLAFLCWLVIQAIYKLLKIFF